MRPGIPSLDVVFIRVCKSVWRLSSFLTIHSPGRRHIIISRALDRYLLIALLHVTSRLSLYIIIIIIMALLNTFDVSYRSL